MSRRIKVSTLGVAPLELRTRGQGLRPRGRWTGMKGHWQALLNQVLPDRRISSCCLRCATGTASTLRGEGVTTTGRERTSSAISCRDRQGPQHAHRLLSHPGSGGGELAEQHPAIDRSGKVIGIYNRTMW